MPKDAKLFTVSISKDKHPDLRETLDQSDNVANHIRAALVYYLDKDKHQALTAKDYKLLEHLKAFGTWDILLTLSEKGMLSNKEIFFDTMLKAINFSQSVFQGSVTADTTTNTDHKSEASYQPPNIFAKGQK